MDNKKKGKQEKKQSIKVRNKTKSGGERHGSNDQTPHATGIIIT